MYGYQQNVSYQFCIMTEYAYLIYYLLYVTLLKVLHISVKKGF